MSVELTQTGNWLNFIFSNTGPEASFIDGVYFSDPPPSLLGGAPTFEYTAHGEILSQLLTGRSPQQLGNDVLC